MLYRIDFEHFLVHAIDHFTRVELNSFHYVILSAGIVNTGKAINVVKINTLFPDYEIYNDYLQYKNLERFKENYFNQLEDYKEDVIYRSIISPLIKHKSLLLICRRMENFIIDVLSEYLLKEFKVDTIDLNHLFINGVINNFNFSLEEFKESCVNFKIDAAKKLVELKEKSPSGRAELFAKMDEKDKRNLIKKIGYNPKNLNLEQINSIIKNEWIPD